MYPLRFEPTFRRYIWGGRRLASVLNKPIGEEDCAESWEVVDHNDDQSVVRFGDLAGKSLRELMENHGEELLGKETLKSLNEPNIPPQLRGRFPLLLKFLDANRNLSVQVHPDDKMGATLTPPDLGKTEAWYVMHADPGSKIYAGLKQGVTRDQLREDIQQGETESLLHSFEPTAGDCVFIQAGTIHAIGAGLLIAEIQQASDTTFRVFDWNRVDKDGKPRDLHIEDSLQASNFDIGPINAVTPQPTDHPNAMKIVESSKFIMSRWTSDQPIAVADDQLHILAVTKGAVTITGDPSETSLGVGQTALIPASCTDVNIVPEADSELLDIVVPTNSSS